MAFGIGDSLSVRVSANTADFTTGISRAQDSLDDLDSDALQTAAALQILQNRADEAGDEISGAGRDASGTATRLGILSGAAGSASSAFTTLSASTSGLSLSFGSLTTSLTGTIGLMTAVGAVATGLVSTLLPLAAVVGTVTAGLGALAAAFGTVLGTGIIAFGAERGRQNQERLQEVRDRIEGLERLKDEYGVLTDAQEEELERLQDLEGELEDQTGIMGGLQSVMSDLAEELQPIVEEFGEQFIPLIEDAVEAIPDLVRNIFDAIGGLDRFAQELRRLGRFAFRVIPEIAGSIFDLARFALPILLDFIQQINFDAESAFGGMLRVTRELAPLIIDLGNALIDALPELTSLGTFILKTAIPAFTDFVNLVEDIIQIGEGSESLADFLGTLLDNAVTWFNETGKPRLKELGTNLINEFTTALSPGDNEDATLEDALINRLGSVFRGINTWLEEDGRDQITSAINTLFNELENFLTENREDLEDQIVEPLQSIIENVALAISEALTSDELTDLQIALGNAARNFFKFLAGELIEFVQSDEFVQILDNLGQALINVLIAWGQQAIRKSIAGMNVGTIIASELASRLSGINADEIASEITNDQTNVPTTGTAAAVQQAQQQNQEVVVRVEEDTELVDTRIEEGANTALEEKRRRALRNTGRSGGNF